MSDQQRFPEDEATPFPDETISDPLIDMDATPVPEELTDPGKTTQTRAPSRTTRILLGLLLLAVAAFVWFNNFRQPAVEPVVTTGAPLAPASGPARLPGGNGNGNAPAAPLVSSQNGGPAGTQRTDSDLPSPSSGPVVPVVVLDEDGEPVLPFALSGVVARELVVSDLPFLVTEPAPDTDPASGTAEPVQAERPATQRASINPFSPVVLAPVPEADTAFAGPAPEAVEPGAPEATLPDGTGETVIDVSIPSGPGETAVTTVQAPGSDRPSATQRPASVPPSTTTQAPTAPAPTAVAPAPPPAAAGPAAGSEAVNGVASARAQSLPRVLPGPSLSPVPQVLQERRSVEDIPQPNLAQVAIISEPDEAPAANGDLETAALASASEQAHEDDPRTPLQPVASRVMPSDADPLVAGVTPLSRYLRDNDVSFTGMVLGPVSHGVFRSINQPRPMVIAIGQELPDTQIVLTDLRGQEAEFTLADATQSLTLDLRR